MGRIICQVAVEGVIEPVQKFEFSALVDTGASFLTLPTAWKEKLGGLTVIRKVQLETATQDVIEGEICGPVKIQIEGFRPIFGEVLFIEMNSGNGSYEPLVGYIVLESSQIAVDMLGHRLVPVKYVDLK